MVCSRRELFCKVSSDLFSLSIQTTAWISNREFSYITGSNLVEALSVNVKDTHAHTMTRPDCAVI